MMVLFLAWFLATRLDAMRRLKQTILPAIVMPVVFMLLIVKQPDLGTALVLFGVTAMMLWLAGIDWKWLVVAWPRHCRVWRRCCSLLRGGGRGCWFS